MKYVMLAWTRNSTTRHIPVVFPDMIVHKDMADYVAVLLSQKYGIDVKPVSAGFVTYIGERVCVSGNSETLRLSSRPEDTYLIQMHDYNAGIL